MWLVLVVLALMSIPVTFLAVEWRNFRQARREMKMLYEYEEAEEK